MAWVFVRLKLRLLANGLRTKGWRVVGVVLGALYGLGLAAVGFAALAASRHRPDGEVIAVLLGSALALGWAVLPIIGYGTDETLDPTRLALLPLRRRQLITGLLAASTVGVGGCTTIFALSGGIVGFAKSPAGAVLVVLAVAGQALLCVALGRALITALSASLRSRRGRDLRVILVALVAFLPQSLRFIRLPRHGTSFTRFHHLAQVLGWLPTGLAMRAMAAAGHNRLAVASVELIGVAATLALIVWWWAATVEHLFTTSEATATTRPRTRTAARTGETPLFGLALGWLPRTRLGAVAAREVRSNWREPRRRVQVVSSFLLPFIVLAGVLARGNFANHHKIVFSSLLVIALGGNRTYNQLGMDGPAWWVHESSGTDLAADLSGKNLAFVLISMPAVLLAALVLAALSSGWVELLPTIPLAFALTGVQLAIGNVLSIQAPWPVPSSAANLWATSSGQGCLAGVFGLVGLGVQALVAAPFAVALALTHGWLTQAVVVVVALATGYGLWRLGLRIALRAGRGRGPELLATVSGSRPSGQRELTLGSAR